MTPSKEDLKAREINTAEDLNDYLKIVAPSLSSFERNFCAYKVFDKIALSDFKKQGFNEGVEASAKATEAFKSSHEECIPMECCSRENEIVEAIRGLLK